MMVQTLEIIYTIHGMYDTWDEAAETWNKRVGI